MNASSSVRKLILALAVVSSATPVHACLTCMGADSTTGPALNGAIFFMLGTLGAVFLGIGGVVFSFWRRARAPLPPHYEFQSNPAALENIHST
jgi:hypothetical protein